MSKQIFLDAPNLGQLEKEYLIKAIDTGYVSTVGPLVPEFENKFAKYLGIKKAVSTQSGTAAIHMALYELGIGKGDEVLVPALTFVATVNPVLYVRAKPVMVDVDIATWNISPRDIEKKITKKTKAIIPVHLYGNPSDMSAIMRIARKHGLFVIEDATESLGAKYKGSHTGTFGDFGCFSFNGNKIITTGGGGMVVGKNMQKLEHIKFLVNQARDGVNEYYHPEIGFNYRMTNIEAALGLAQMRKLDRFLAKKRQINAIFKEELKGIKSICFQEEYSESNSAYWLTCIIFKKQVNLLSLQKELKTKGVPTRRIFMPLRERVPYRTAKKDKFRNAYFIYERGLCLPSSTLNSKESIYRICKRIKKLI